MTTLTTSPDESLRLSALLKLAILDTPREERFDRITRLTQRLFNVPIAIISLVDRDRQWFKSCLGIDLVEVSRELSFCKYTLTQQEPLVVPDTLLDPRFIANPFVVGEPYVRFYAGHTLYYDGLAVGSICIIDYKPRDLDMEDRAALRDIAQLIQNEFGTDQLKISLQERQQAENELYRSEQQFRALTENSPDAIARVDRQGRYVYVNPAFERAATRPISLTLGSTAAEMDSPGNASEQWLASIKKVVETGQPDSYEISYLPRNSDFSRYYHISSVPEFGPDGQVEFVLGVSRDITESKLAEIKLRQSEELFATLFNNAPVSISVMRLEDNVYLEVNKRFLELRGYSREEVIGHSSRELGWSDPEERTRLAKELSKQKGVSNWPYNVRAKNGQLIYGIVSSEKIIYKGEVCALITFVDITERKRMETELRHTQEHFASLFQTVPVAISLVRLSDGVYLEVNNAVTETLGRSREDIIGNSAAKYGWTEKQDRERVLKALKEHGLVSGLEYKIRNSAGELRKGYVNAMFINYNDEPCILSCFIDTTDTDRMEKELHESQERFASLFQVAPVSLTLLRLSDGIFLEVNDTMLKNSGFKREDIVGRDSPALGWSNPEQDESLSSLLRQHGKISNFEYEVSVASGERRQGYINANIINYNGELCLISSFFDATELRQVQKELRESQEHLQTMLDNLPVTLFTLNQQGLITSLEGNNSEKTLLSPFISIGWNVLEVLKDRLEVVESLQQLLKGNPMNGLFTFDNISLEIHALPAYDVQGHLAGAVGVIVNVTERVRTEDELRRSEEKLLQSQKMEAIGRLAGGVAHDFNNLLTAILGYADLLSFELEEADSRHELVVEIKAAGERAASLTRQLLAFSRKQMLQPKTLNLNTVVEGTVKLLFRLIGERVEFVLQLDPYLGLVKADPNQVEQILINLAVNARDALESKGGGQLLMETKNVVLDEASFDNQFKAEPGAYVMLSVSDNGTGMDAKTMSHIFEPFFTTKEVGRGTGLGLSTVYGIIKQSGGYIWPISQVGIGTTFKIYLPRLELASLDEVKAAARPALSSGSETVLLVEDEDRVRNLVSKILTRHGYKVLEASNGKEALRICQNDDSIKVVITDVVMPKMTGPELAHLFRSLRPNIKILFVSGYSDQTIFDNSTLEMQPGSAFLEKPFTAEGLVGKLRQLLKSS